MDTFTKLTASSGHVDGAQFDLSIPVLRAALHWRVEPPFLPDLPAVHDRAVIIGRMVGRQLHQAMQDSGCMPDAVIVSGTVLGSSLSDQPDMLAAFYGEIQRASGVCPSGVATAYQCAGWGYVMRFFARHTGTRHLAILLVDIDLHNFQTALDHAVIGASGFGVTTLLLDLQAGSCLVTCGGPYRNSAYSEFITELKKKQKQLGAVPTFIPFMRKDYSLTPERVLASGSLGPNLNDELGHCFGADPWIGVIRHLEGQPRHLVALVGSVGFKGYFTVAQVEIMPESVLGFRTFVLGSAGELFDGAGAGGVPAPSSRRCLTN